MSLLNRYSDFVQERGKKTKVALVGAGQMGQGIVCLLYTSPSPRDSCASRMPSSA